MNYSRILYDRRTLAHTPLIQSGDSRLLTIPEFDPSELFSTVTPAKKVLGRKLGRVCDSEIEFLRKGLEKHGFEAPPADGTLHGYVDRFGMDRGKLFTFYELRSLLGSIVETVVVLDRFLFILESGAVSKVALVQAFDPVVSPRCCALVGLT